MTDPQTPATEAGRRQVETLVKAGWDRDIVTASVLAIEAEARTGYMFAGDCLEATRKARALDVDVLARALWDALYPDGAARSAHDAAAEIADRYRAILVGEVGRE